MPPRPAPGEPRELPQPPQSAAPSPRPLPSAPQPRSLPHRSRTGTPASASPSLIPAPHSSRNHAPRSMGTSASSLTPSSSPSDAITPQKRSHANSTRNLLKGRGKVAPPISPHDRIARAAGEMDVETLERELNDEANADPQVAREVGVQQIKPIQREGIDSVNRDWEMYQKLVANYKEGVVVSQTPPVLAKKEDWKTTGVISGGDQLRARSIFPSLARDGGLDRGKEGASCRKLYSLSSKSGLTGGISAIWCTHKICYVAHTMFNAEGRNDIFAAAYCYLPDPPDIFVYDYACQLATYSLVREPEHFKDTRFYVDELHAHGHTKCSSAFFLAQAIKQDPTLRHLNSSAAECAHSTIGRIRKSMRYMTEAHGILLMNTIMQLWNRKMLDTLLKGRVVKVV